MTEAYRSESLYLGTSGGRGVDGSCERPEDHRQCVRTLSAKSPQVAIARGLRGRRYSPSPEPRGVSCLKMGVLAGVPGAATLLRAGRPTTPNLQKQRAILFT
jgi:hypothetical protein